MRSSLCGRPATRGGHLVGLGSAKKVGRAKICEVGGVHAGMGSWKLGPRTYRFLRAGRRRCFITRGGSAGIPSDDVVCADREPLTRLPGKNSTTPSPVKCERGKCQSSHNGCRHVVCMND